MSRYLRILRGRAALVPFLAAVVARFPVAMAPLGIVLLVQSVRGSYALAGLVTAAFALGAAVATPAWGGLVDRLGQPRIIAPLSAGSAALLATLAIAVVAGAPDGVLLGLAVGVGLAFPPISPAMRGAWRVILSEDADRRAAYALEAVTIELVFVCGPLLLSLLLVTTRPVVPLLVTAAFLGVGGLTYSATPAARAWRSEPHHEGAGHRSGSPLRAPGVLAVLAVSSLVAIGFGQLDVTIAAIARETLGAQARVGLLFTAIAGGSAIGGLLYGARAWRAPERLRLPVVLTTFGCGLAAVAVLLGSIVPPLWALLPLLFLTGLSIAPGIIVQANLVDRYAPRDRLNEAQSWLNTTFTAGGAAGTAAAGLLVDAGGPAHSIIGAAAAILLAALAALAAQRIWRVPLRQPLSSVSA